MTKKDYEKAASITNEWLGTETFLPIEQAFVDLFLDDNPYFNEEKFRHECRKKAKP